MDNELNDNLQNASYAYAVKFLDGDGVEQNLEAGREMLLNAANAGDLDAAHLLANCYNKGLYGFPVNKEEYFKWLKFECDNDDYPIAWYLLATAYENGEGTEKDNYLAFEWYKKAADAGYVGALMVMPELYAKGIGTDTDIEKAKEYLEIYRNHEECDEEYLKTTEILFSDWESNAQQVEKSNKRKEYLQLYLDFKNGTNGYPKDPEQAFYWINKALNEYPDDPNLQVLVGICYLDGCGVPVDMERGIDLVKKSADANLGYGQFIYGRLHHYGGGSIEKDLVTAEYLMQQAIKNGWPQAENELQDIQQELADQNLSENSSTENKSSLLNNFKGKLFKKK